MAGGKFAALLMKAKGPPPLEEVEGGEETEAIDPKRERVLSVASDLISAVKTGSAEGVADALLAAYDVCSESGEM